MKISVIGGGPGGLYFALLMKRRRPDWDIHVVERNRADVTWGWGVVFSAETLGHFQEADPESYKAITDNFIWWDDIDVHFQGEVVRSTGHGFCGVARKRLLILLQQRCAELGVRLTFETDVEDLSPYADSDLIVAADGINSKIRAAHEDAFQPTLEPGKSKFIWLGTTQLFDAFTFIFRENEHGFFQVHAYRFDKETSTFIVETDEETFEKAGLGDMSVDDGVEYCRKLFEPELGEHKLLTNHSAWINFRRVKNATWHHKNIVLIGDSAHTAHFSIGSGTKLAMEDSIALADALDEQPEDIQGALASYQDSRWVDVAKLQKSAQTSRRWFEHIKRYKDLSCMEMTISLLTRSKRITHENLKLRDPDFIARADRWYANTLDLPAEEPAPPPMFTPFRLREMELQNRVVVSPMCQYSADDGTPGDWHLMHLGARAVGGAGLVIAEMTNVSAEARITPGCTGIYTEAHASAWRRITDFVHTHSSAKIALQLGHAGRKGATKLLWEGADVSLPEAERWPLLAASALPYKPGNDTPKAMDRADMDAVRDDYVRAAKLAEQAGFDMLELHLAHGYLLATFISPLTNQRDDEYGGSIENRMRFPLEVFDAIRAVWPAHKPMSARISATDWAPGGLSEADLLALAKMLKDHECDLIDVSTGQTVAHAEPEYGRMYQTPFSDLLRREVGIATMAVGAIQGWDHVNTIVFSGRADLCAMARPHLLDPHLTLRAAVEQEWAGRGVEFPPQYRAVKPRGT